MLSTEETTLAPWVGGFEIVGADHPLHLGQHRGPIHRGFGHDREGADAFPP